MLNWPEPWLPPINLWNAPKQGNDMTIIKSTVTVSKPYPRNADIIKFFEDKGLYESTNFLAQFRKLEEEVDELHDALLLGDDEQVLNEAGDVYITLVNVLKTCNLTMEQAVNYSTDKILRRSGKVVNGQFVKDE